VSTATEGKPKSAVSTRTVELSGPLSKLMTRSASRHGGYGWVRDLYLLNSHLASDFWTIRTVTQKKAKR
jgi:hypothetical protein